MTDTTVLSNYIRNMLSDGYSEQDVAAQMTSVLNETLKACNKAKATTELYEKMDDLVHQNNLVLENYCKLRGIKKSSYETFTVDDLIEAFENKIEGKSAHIEAPQGDSCKTKEELQIKGKCVVKDLDTGEVKEQDFTEKDLEEAWNFMAKAFGDLLSK